jgi:hypothetical protein
MIRKGKHLLGLDTNGWLWLFERISAQPLSASLVGQFVWGESQRRRLGDCTKKRVNLQNVCIIHKSWKSYGISKTDEPNCSKKGILLDLPTYILVHIHNSVYIVLRPMQYFVGVHQKICTVLFLCWDHFPSLDVILLTTRKDNC